MEKNFYVITDDKFCFWNGSRFSKEFPEAKIYYSPLNAKQDCNRIKNDAYVVVNYGLDNELDIYSNNYSNERQFVIGL